jgi:hypothetical protein
MKRKKIMAYILLTVAVLFILFQSFVYMSTSKTKEQPYTVLEKDGRIEIRLYPPATLATVQSTAKSYSEMASPGFRTLAGYIFGGNESQTQIAMTAPVQVDINDSLSSMSFVMPEGYDMSNLPKPNSSQVILSKTEEQVMAAIRFRGFANDEDRLKHQEELAAYLKSKGIQTKGNYKFLGYNPPYQLFGRRNEVVVEIVR